jgi:hypothetical protein
MWVNAFSVSLTYDYNIILTNKASKFKRFFNRNVLLDGQIEFFGRCLVLWPPKRFIIYKSFRNIL